MKSRPVLVRSTSGLAYRQRSPIPEAWQQPRRPSFVRHASLPQHPWPELDYSPTLEHVPEGTLMLDTLTRARLRDMPILLYNDGLPIPSCVSPITYPIKRWAHRLMAWAKERLHVGNRQGQS